MGSELYEEMGLWSPKEGWETSINFPVAGSYRALGLDLQGTSPEQAARLKQQLEATKTKLESADDVQLATLTKHNLVGDLLYGTVFNYFALNDLQDQIAAQSAGILNYRLPSYGTFSTNLQSQYWFGIPRNVSFSGLSMDIDKLKNQRVAKDNDKDEELEFSQSIGARTSAMEHQVPQEIFKSVGISAVKALTIASQQGQKIWTINKDNLNLALSQINLGPDAETDIRNGVNAGKIATAHEAQINFNGWIGEGYILFDPNTGAGAYMIAGGGNGSQNELPKDRSSGISMVSSVAPALVLSEVANGEKQSTATFFGVVECKLSKVAVTIAVVVALAVTAYLFARLIRAAAAIPEIGIEVGLLIRSTIISALSLAGVANAEEAYKRDCECSSGIVSEYGQCWVCAKESYPPIRQRVVNAKNETGALGGCGVAMSSVDLLIRIEAWSEFIDARIAENSCWEPPHDGHVLQVTQARTVIERCFSLMPK